MYSDKKIDKIEKIIYDKINNAESSIRKNINEWLVFKPLSIYMIIGSYHRLGIPNDHLCLVLSSIGVDEKYKGKGYFKCYMKIINKIATEKGYRVVFESVLSEDVKKWLIKNNYIEIPSINNFYKDF